MSHMIRVRQSNTHRRGNSIVLVSALLVMLVIIATAYVTRTNAGRVTAKAVQTAESRDANADTVAKMLAQIPADALFVRPLDPTVFGFNPTVPADSNAGRLPAQTYPILFGAEARRLNFDLNYPYNHVPNHDIPFTNWPDGPTLVNTYGLTPASWPKGPGNPSGSTLLSFVHEGNPIGNPGFGDNRWMRDLEPIRIDSRGVGDLDAFSHWRHLTYLAMPTNQWRVVRDISDITNVTGVGGTIEDLTIPVEQWPADPSDAVDTVFSNSAPANIISSNTRYFPFSIDATHFGRWQTWSASLGDYQSMLFGLQGLGDGSFAPGNFYRLRDLDANVSANRFLFGGVHQDRPESEFVFGTARNEVSRFLADSDGDGYTDAFWHLVPLPINNGVRMVAAVSIIPNNAMINVNTSTRFQYTDDVTLLNGGNPGFNSRTRGHGPADIALVGGTISNLDFANWNVGFYDDPLNDGVGVVGIPSFDYFTTNWLRHVDDVGLPGGALTQLQRLDYWRRVGLDPLSASAGSFYRPFSLADDLELRMFYGNNYEWVFSQFEHSVQNMGDGFVRAGPSGISESNELANQLINRALVRDPRHRMTMYSAVRNEEIPHWLQYRWFRDVDNDGFLNINDAASLPFAIQQDIANFPGDFNNIVNAFFAQQRFKLDLREPVFNTAGGLFEPGLGRLTFRERLPIALMHALDDWQPRQGAAQREGNSYHGSYSVSLSGGAGASNPNSELGETQRMAASLAANMLAARDDDYLIHLSDDPTTPDVEGPVPVSEVSLNSADVERQFIGVEPQPFFVEAYIGHIYKAILVPAGDFEDHPYLNAGNHVVLHGDGNNSTVVVVQIANPFDVPIDLGEYKLFVFGQEFDIGANMTVNDRILQPASPEQPTTAIFYAIEDDIGTGGLPNLRNKWMDFLDIEATDLTPDTIVHRVMSWSTDRDEYDTWAGDVDIHAFELKRIVEDPVGSGTFVDVVLDRFEPGTGTLANTSREFAEEIADLEVNRPPDQLSDPPDQYDVPPQGSDYQDSPEWDIGPAYDHWVRWVRITRAWGIDADQDGIYQHDERSPRYVIGSATFHGAKVSQYTLNQYPADDRFFHSGNRFVFAADPDDDGSHTGTPQEDVPWFWRDYYPVESTDITTRKPTFFDMNDGVNTEYPDKGWYSQGRNGAIRKDMVDTQAVTTANSTSIRHNFSMQMAHKNSDYEQIGEVLNNWLWGHEVEMSGIGPNRYEQTINTFSEHMARLVEEFASNADRTRLNRLSAGEVTVGYDSNTTNIYLDSYAAIPNQAPGFRVLDLFVCDSYGVDLDFDNDLVITLPEIQFADANLRLSNANGFTGRPVHGMLNPNVAPVEVLRALPHWSRLIYENGNWSRSMIPEAVVQYRERFDDDVAGKPYVLRNQIDPDSDGMYNTWDAGPDYGDRDQLFSNLRDDRGFASVGELMMLQRPATGGAPVDNNKWSINYAGLNPFARISNPNPGPNLDRETVQLSTDLVADRRYLSQVTGEPTSNDKLWDETAGDAEERNMLFAGASNMLTTRTDTFTIYFRLRSFKQNPISGRWDATDPEYIVDDSRYVMLIDRSNVNKPGDKPRILYFEKLPN